MQRRYENEDVSELIYTAGFLDPRFRLNYVAVDDVPHIKDCIAREATKIHEVLEIESGDNNSTQPDEQAPPDAPLAKKRKLHGFPLQEGDRRYTDTYCRAESQGGDGEISTVSTSSHGVRPPRLVEVTGTTVPSSF